VYAQMGNYDKAILLDSLGGGGRYGSIYKFLKIIEEEGLENAKKWEKAQDNKPSKLDFSWFVAYMQNADMALAINEHLHSKIGNEDTTTADVLRAYVLNDRAFIYYRVGLYGKAMELQ